MKFKYKKIILFTLLSTMGIGVVTLAVTPHNRSNNTSISSEAKGSGGSSDVTPTLATALTPTYAPTPTPLPVYNLETTGYSDIAKLMKAYYSAKLDCSVTKLKKLLSDPSNIETKKQLKKDIIYVEKYKNIKCYVKKGYIAGTYIVYVYNEIKFINIKTPAPAVYQFYVVTDSKGKLKIFSGEFDSATEAYYNERKNDADVKALIESTNSKAEKAKKKDKDLKTFWKNLEKAQASESN